MNKNPTPALPLSGEGVEVEVEVETEVVEYHRAAPPPGKGEAGRGLKPKLHNLHPQKNRRCQLRKNPTEPEKRFWSWVRGKQLGTKFRRQHGIGRYIVDFYCAEHALIVEIDGDSHYGTEAIAYDAARTEFLMAKGFHVIRFTNHEIMQNREGVLISLMKRMTQVNHHG